MADGYEPNASGLITAQSASDLGSNQSRQAINIGQTNAMDSSEIQQRMTQTQLMQQQLQQKMQENHDSMVTHIGQQANQLASADDDDKKGPVWKMQVQDLTKKMQSMGMQVDPDVLTTYMKDPTHSGKFTSALSAVMDPKSDPHTQAQALSTLHDNFGSMDEAIKAPDELLDAHARVMAASNKVNSISQTQAKGIRDSVSKINQKWDTSQSFADTASNILKNWSTFQTGQGEVALKDAYNKAMSGGAPRSFTLAMMDNNRSVGNKLDGYFSKLDSGIKLQPDERKDMANGLRIMAQDNNTKRDNEVSTYHGAAQGVLQRSGGDIKPGDMIPPEQWNRLEDQQNQTSFNQSTNKFESTNQAPQSKPKKQVEAPQIQSYELGKNSGRDNFLKSTISSGHSLSEVNQILGKYKMRMSQDDYNNLKGNQ